MKVSILTEGGSNIGLGHVCRCTSIYEAFVEIGAPVEMVVSGDETTHGLLQGKNHRIVDWLDNEANLFEIIADTTVVFVDSYLAEADIYREISETVQTAVYLDDYIRIDYPRGYVLNGAVGAEQMPYPKGKDVIYLLGSDYTPLRKAFWNVPPKVIGSEIRSILVTFGGVDSYNLTPTVVNTLNSIVPNVKKKVVIARGYRNTTEIARLASDKVELVYYPESTDMANLMIESDIAISACGQTLYELARTGVPTVGICTADNQLQNINGWMKTGFLEYVGRHNDENMEGDLKSSLGNLADKCLRARLSRIGRKVIDGQGHMRIISAITKEG